MGGQPELAAAVGVSTAFADSNANAAGESQADRGGVARIKIAFAKNFSLAGHLNQILALWPKGG